MKNIGPMMNQAERDKFLPGKINWTAGALNVNYVVYIVYISTHIDLAKTCFL